MTLRSTPQRARPGAVFALLTAQLLSLPPLAAAQVGPTTPLPETSTIFWPVGPGFGGGGPFRQVLSADLTGDLRDDAVVLDGGQIVFLYGVQSYSARSELTPGNIHVLDMAVLPGSEHNTLYSTSSLGLTRHEFDPTTATFTHVLANNFRWRSAQHVRVHNLDGLFGPDLVSVAADGHSLLTLFDDGAGGFLSGYTVVFQGTIEALELADWDGDGFLEIAGLSASGLEVFERDGARVGSFPTSHAGGYLTSMPRKGGGDCLCWVARNPSDSHFELRTLASDVEFQPQPLVFPPQTGLTAIPIDVVGLRADDLDDDGFEDLLLAHASFQRAIVLVNTWTQGALPHDPFSVANGSYGYYDLSDDPLQVLPVSKLDPAFADVDQDDHADILYPLEDSPPRLRVLMQLDPGGGEELTGANVVQHVEFGPDPSGLVAQLHLLLNIPHAILTGPWDHAQVVVWKQEQKTKLEADALDNVLYELKDSAPMGQDLCHQKLVVDIPGESPAVPWTGPARHYYVDLRFVIAQPGNPPQVSLPTKSLMHGWTMSDDLLQQPYGPYAQYLMDMPAGNTEIGIRDVGFHLNPPGGVIIGIDVPLGRIPNHGEQDVPKPGEPNTLIKDAVFW